MIDHPRHLPRLSAPPEWWQATATIVGIIGCIYLLAVVVPFSIGWDPLGSFVAFQSLPFRDFVSIGIDVAVMCVFALYIVAAVTDRAYQLVDWRHKLFPWIVFLGVMLPLVPAVAYWFFALSSIHNISQGWGLIGHRTAAGLAMFMVPLFNWVCAYRVLWRDDEATPALSFMNGIALASAPIFCVVFWQHDSVWPGLPIAGVGMLAGSLGAICTAVVLGTAKPAPSRRAHFCGVIGILFGFALFVLPVLNFEFHAAMARCAASSSSPEAHRVAVRMLRAFGNRDDLLRGAYGTFDDYSLISGEHGSEPSLAEEFRRCCYWVHGKAFNEVAPPWDVQFMQLLRRDRDLASENVGEKNRAVSLEHSRIQGTIDSVKLVAKIDWAMNFANSTDIQQEARLELLVPAGAVVSRAVLYIDDIPHTAVIAGTEEAREAYRSVVLQQRDPLLVSWKGSDRIMVQCYPIPPKNSGRTMRIAIELNAPMQTPDGRIAEVELPVIVDSNFVLPSEPPEFSFRGVTLAERPTIRDGKVMLDRPAIGTPPAQAPALRVQNRAAAVSVVQALAPTFSVKPAYIAVVVDGGASMAPYRDGIIDSLARIPNDVRCEVFFASDELSSLTTTPADLRASLKELRYAPFVGGPDNSVELRRAIDGAVRAGDASAVVWIHGPQPVFGSCNVSPDRVEFFDIPVGGGTNVYASKLNSARVVHAGGAQYAQKLAGFIDEVCGRRKKFLASWELSAPLRDATEVRRLLSIDPARARERAINAGIVSPVTSAVVLETTADYVELYEDGAGRDYSGREVAISAPLIAVDEAQAIGAPEPVPVPFAVPQAAAAGTADGTTSGTAARLFRSLAAEKTVPSGNTQTSGGSAAKFLPRVFAETPTRSGDSRTALAVLFLISIASVLATGALAALLALGVRKEWYRRRLPLVAMVALCFLMVYLCMQTNTIVNAVKSLSA